MILRLDIAFPSTLLAVRQVATVVRSALAPVLEDAAVESVELAVVEASTNIVKHGARGDATKVLRVRLEVEADTVRVSFFDQGQSFDPSRRRELEVDPGNIEALPTSGMGIPVIHEIMDSVTYQVTAQGNVMTMEKRARVQEPGTRDETTQP